MKEKKKKAKRAREEKKEKTHFFLLQKLKNTSQLATATVSRSRGSTRGTLAATCRSSRWRVRRVFFLSLFFLIPRRGSRGGDLKVRENSKNTLSSLSPRFSKTIVNKQDTARTPTCTSTGSGTSRSRCREKQGEREVFFSQSFSLFFVSLGSTATPPTPTTKITSVPPSIYSFVFEACGARAYAFL